MQPDGVGEALPGVGVGRRHGEVMRFPGVGAEQVGGHLAPVQTKVLEDQRRPLGGGRGAQRLPPDGPVGVFTGDALFVGDVGRTDFYPDRKHEVAGLLYDSLQKILELGDQVILYPAHGAGSVCGSGMAEREFSTLGHERANNPRLQFESRDAFVDFKVAENHYQPHYFRLMERLNLEGGSASPRVMRPKRLTLAELGDLDVNHLVDVREPLAFASGHLPGSMNLPVGMISAFSRKSGPRITCRIG